MSDFMVVVFVLKHALVKVGVEGRPNGLDFLDLEPAEHVVQCLPKTVRAQLGT
jgi:hypothetical protein